MEEEARLSKEEIQKDEKNEKQEMKNEENGNKNIDLDKEILSDNESDSGEESDDEESDKESTGSGMKHLVVDTNAIIKGVRLEQLAPKLYTIQEVIHEVRDKNARNFLETFPFPIEIRDPSDDDIKKVIECAKKGGEYSSLSIPDIKLIALTYMLEKEIEGDYYINGGKPKIQKQETKPNDDVNDDGEGEWITPDNIDSVTEKMKGLQSSFDRKVGCITTDYAMQAVLMKMYLNVITIDGFQLKRIKKWVFKCEGCSKITKDMEKKFCPYCGNASLVRAVLCISKSGKEYCQTRARKHLRGTKYSIPKPKGGKQNKDLILAEDQYLQEVRKARRSKPSKKVYDQVFGEKVITTNVVIGYGKKNPNESRRRIGKKNKSHHV